MKKLAMLFSGIIISLQSFSQLDDEYFSYPITGIETTTDMHLAGNVKKVVLKDKSSFTFSPSGKITEYLGRDYTTDDGFFKRTYTYDAQDRLIEKRHYADQLDKKFKRTQMVYNDTAFTCVINTYNENDSLTYTTTNSYTETWLPLKIGSTTYKYGLNWILEKTCYISGKCITYTYNSDNRITKIASSGTDYTSYSYNEKGNMTLMQEYSGSKLVKKVVYSYNDLNVLTRRVKSTYTYPKTGSAVTTTDQINYAIKTDDQGNWVSVTKSGDTFDRPETRTINYY